MEATTNEGATEMTTDQFQAMISDGVAALRQCGQHPTGSPAWNIAEQQIQVLCDRARKADRLLEFVARLNAAA